MRRMSLFMRGFTYKLLHVNYIMAKILFEFNEKLLGWKLSVRVDLLYFVVR